SDEAMITALEAVMAERACRKALLAAAEPAKRWFGEMCGDDVTSLELPRIDAAVKWCAELRRAFDAVDVVGGDGGRTTAWRALVAQVAASTDETSPAFGRFAEHRAAWATSLDALSDLVGIERAALGAGEDHLASLREQ